MGTPNILSQQIDETGATVQAVVVVDPNTPSNQEKVNPDGSTIQSNRWTKLLNVVAVAVTAGTPVDFYTPTSGKKFRIVGWNLIASAGSSIKIQDASGVNAVIVPCSVNSPNMVPNFLPGYLSTAANNHIFLDVGITATVNGHILITEE